MPTLSATEIYAAARIAGFTPDQAVTMTAIALAESGGRTDAQAVGEDSRGLWQIHIPDHGWAAKVDLSNPVEAARAAYRVSGGGQDISRWSVTHQSKGSRYLRFMDEAKGAAAAHGEGFAVGNSSPPLNYSDRRPAAFPGTPNPPFQGQVPAEWTAPPAAPPLTAPPADPAGDPFRAMTGRDRVSVFLEQALAQKGNPYIFGANVQLDDRDPDTFDCSELVRWAAHEVGVKVPDGSWIQYRTLHQKGASMSVDEALRTPGALLFRFSSDPLASANRPDSAHVAISLGDGRTIEARGTKWGVGTWEAGDRFTHAAVIPEMAGAMPPGLDATPPAGSTPVWDHDRDGLSNLDEMLFGTDPMNAATHGTDDMLWVIQQRSSGVNLPSDVSPIPGQNPFDAVASNPTDLLGGGSTSDVLGDHI